MSKLCISYEPMTIETLQGYAEVEARIHGRDVRTKIIMSKKVVA